MEKFTLQFRSAKQRKKLLLILLCFSFIGLQAQNSIVPAGATVEKLSSNQYIFTEGPVWYNDSVLLFVDDFMSGSSSDIYLYDPITNHFIKWPSNSTHCTGLCCDKDGNLIGASVNIIQINGSGQLVKTLASGFNGKRFNNPNDIIADYKGGVYFTDPDFGAASPPQDKTAVYYVDSTGNVTRVIDELENPNGLILSPDGTKLYVDEVKNKHLYSWDVASDGSVSGKLSLADLQFDADSYTDGMAIDIYGNIYVATDQGIQVVSPQGVAITTIEVPETPSNCDFGGSDFKTLYITAWKNIYSIDLNYPGYAVSRNGLIYGINTVADKSLVEVYPNPARNILYIHYASTVKVSSIEILSMDGKIRPYSMNKAEEPRIELNIQNLNPGMYLLRLITNEGMIMRKFVKE